MTGAKGLSWLGCLLLALGIVAGCGRGGGLDKSIVEGKVSYQGTPLTDGQIRLNPKAGTKGPASVAFIENGRFRFTARGGVQSGTYQVEVLSYRPIPGAKPYTAEQADGHPEIKVGDIPREQFIPPKYNTKSTLDVTIEAGSGEITKDFDLT
jgi:hypothetical protein